MANIEYNIEARIIDDLPKVIMEFIYKDEFSNDFYSLESHPNQDGGSKEIPFTVIKNYQDKSEIVLSQRDIEPFMESFFEWADDYDFKRESEKAELSQIIKEEVDDFFNRYDNIVLSAGITTEGEVKRMRELAGLIRDGRVD